MLMAQIVWMPGVAGLGVVGLAKAAESPKRYASHSISCLPVSRLVRVVGIFLANCILAPVGKSGHALSRPLRDRGA